LQTHLAREARHKVRCASLAHIGGLIGKAPAPVWKLTSEGL